MKGAAERVVGRVLRPLRLRSGSAPIGTGPGNRTSCPARICIHAERSIGVQRGSNWTASADPEGPGAPRACDSHDARSGARDNASAASRARCEILTTCFPRTGDEVRITTCAIKDADAKEANPRRKRRLGTNGSRPGTRREQPDWGVVRASERMT